MAVAQALLGLRDSEGVTETAEGTFPWGKNYNLLRQSLFSAFDLQLEEKRSYDVPLGL